MAILDRGRLLVFENTLSGGNQRSVLFIISPKQGPKTRVLSYAG